MPGYQLTDQERNLIIDSLKLRYDIIRNKYYNMLCVALGIVSFDISDNYFVDSGAFIIQKVKAIDEHTRLKDICKAKIALFEAEHRGNRTVSDEDNTYLAEVKAELKIQEDIISEIHETFNLLTSLKQLINRLEGNASNYNWKQSTTENKTVCNNNYEASESKEPHPLADFTSPNDRLLGPTDTLIG